MSSIVRIDSGNNPRLVGDTGYALMLAEKNGFNIIDGFIIPANTHMLDGVTNEIMSAFHALHASKVVLRASHHPFHFDSETIRGVRRESLISTIEYMQKKAWRRGENPAIVVQKDVNSEVSGTIYSVNPVTRNSSEMMIEANLWMNGTVLSGESEPDIILLAKNSGALRFENNEEDEISLTPRQIAELHAMARYMENKIGRPASVDWSYDGGKLYVLNIRPINERTFARFE